MVTDSLRYWATEMRVDGFRFDLATILGREPHGFDQGGGFLNACRQDPVLSQLKLIAEPWDLGPGGYQVGGFPPGWAEWNDRFRDTARTFWKGDEGSLADFATRLTGSADLFDQRGRRPFASVNFVTAHDGFTLADLVSYDHKHNEANGEDNQDGSDHNLSWNHGAEGPTDDEAINTLRRRQMRNLLATLLLAQGTPMLLAGDEFARTQQGNNNAYCQDNEIAWIDWQAAAQATELTDFVRQLIALRQRYPLLRRGRFFKGLYDEEFDIRDVTWLAPDGEMMDEARWQDPQARCLGMLLDGRAQPTGLRRPGAETTLLLLVNAHHEPVEFLLPSLPDRLDWRLLVGTDKPGRRRARGHACGDTLALPGRTTMLLRSHPRGSAGQGHDKG
jgi:glycogen operon protein